MSSTHLISYLVLLNFSLYILQLVMAFMECLETCVGNVTQLSLTEELFIEHIHSLPSAVLQTVNATFKHCKVHSN